MKKVLLGIALLASLVGAPKQANAQWVPVYPVPVYPVPIVYPVPVVPVYPVPIVVPTYRCQYVWNGWGWNYACY